MNWYQLEADEMFRKLDATEGGLSDEDVRQRFARFGPNKLAEAEKISRFRILLHQFTSPLIYILLIAGGVTIVLREYTDAGVIFAVVILNAIIGFTQEYKAEESVRALRKLTVPRAGWSGTAGSRRSTARNWCREMSSSSPRAPRSRPICACFIPSNCGWTRRC